MKHTQKKNRSGQSYLHLSEISRDRDLRIRVPRIEQENQYIAVLGELGSALRKPFNYSNVVVEVADTTDLTLSLAAVLFRIREDLRRSGHEFKVVGVPKSKQVQM